MSHEWERNRFDLERSPLDRFSDPSDDYHNCCGSARWINKLNVSVNLRESVRLFLHSYVGYTDASILSKIYLSIIENSTSKQQLDENIDKITVGNSTKVDERSAEALRNLHERITRDYF